MKKLTIRLKVAFHDGKEQYSPGDVVTLDKATAEDLLRRGYAETLVTPKTPKNAKGGGTATQEGVPGDADDNGDGANNPPDAALGGDEED